MKKNINIDELHLLVGLPGSGKTTYANSTDNVNPYGPTKSVVDFDKIQQKINNIKNHDDRFEALIWRACLAFKSKIVFLDGLFLTQNDYEYILSLYFRNPVYDYHIKKVIVDYWIPDREACLYNDMGRRSQSSATSIKNLKIEKPDIVRLKSYFPNVIIKLVEHQVVKMPEYKKFALENNITLKNDRYLKSCTWCLGGSGHSWDGHTYSISAEEPCEFTEFDDILMKLCPNITYLQYKKVRSACVTCETERCDDYYSETEDGFYLCDMKVLFDMLKEMKIL